MKSLLKISFKFLLLVGVMLPQSVWAGTVLEDVELNLNIEVNDVLVDFEDEGEVVEKERRVTYALEIKNKGPDTHHKLRVFMGDPHYMEYQSGTTQLYAKNEISLLGDVGGISPLAAGYTIESLAAGESLHFELQYKVIVPNTVYDDPLYTVAFASLVGEMSALPLMSNAVNTTISGNPLGSLSVKVTPQPPTTETVFKGSILNYVYELTNGGGQPVSDINLITHQPEGTTCLNHCGSLFLPQVLESGQSTSVEMKVEVNPSSSEQEVVENIGFDIASSTLPLTEIREQITHFLNGKIEVGTHDFTLYTEQVPNLILNSPDSKPRPDQGDRSETQYALHYTGRGQLNTYQPSGSFGIQDSGYKVYEGYCSDHVYPHGRQSTVYAYNSYGGGCEKLSDCPLSSRPLQFFIQTQLPEGRPRLITLDTGMTSKSAPFQYGDTASVNQFMRSGGVIKLPEDFTMSRAVENGLLGTVQSSVTSQSLTEDLWTYQFTGQYKAYDTCSCGKDCRHTDKYPVYTWQRTDTQPLTLFDEDETSISVYSSTAWLKTEGGHLGTNGKIYNHGAEANRVTLNFGGGVYMTPNRYVHESDPLLTPSDHYTPIGEHNGQRLIFGQNDPFSSSAGESWEVIGTHFDFLERGEPYNRENFPREFKADLLDQEKYGPVRLDELPDSISKTFDIGSNVVWHHLGDLVLGEEGEEVIFSGGQSRFYVEGDVYINADVFYELSQSNHYDQVTALRIDAQNIYIHPEVQNLELLMLAREGFYSGESYHQLRILGDVIASQVFWQRKPVLELDPEDINPPSEYIIEDYRKFVLPPPGDSTLPDEYGWWQHSNPGEV